MAPAIWPIGLLVLLATGAPLSATQEVPNLPGRAPLSPLWRDKKADIDLQTCIDNFNVHKDKIIRTQDSQSMGARYLNEADLGSREECLRLCCETDDCDVFVFEEKNEGSCYLFHCGPPEDFKCKFTHHVNYSSAVLAVNRRPADLEHEIKLTKHLQELARLRAKPAVDAPRSTTSTTPVPVITQEVVPVQKDAPVRKCSRYQFECRSNGECIAIYNACDGIPQCADGSDEAPELGCPAPEAVAAAQSTSAPPRTAAPQLAYGREGELVQQHRQQQPAIYSNPYQVQQDADILRQPARAFDPAGVNWGGNWVPPAPQFPEGRRQGEAPLVPAQPYPEYPGRLSNYYADNYNQPVQQEHWPPDKPRYAPQPAYRPEHSTAPGQPDGVSDFKRLGPPVAPQESQHDQDEMAHDLKHSKDGMQVAAQYVRPFKVAEDTQDGLARIPRGAIVSLTIGLVITAVMATLIGCRLRVVNRRLRKGEKGYAHDADYLVNGMYL